MFRVRDILRFGYGQLMFRLRGEHEGNMKKYAEVDARFRHRPQPGRTR